MIRRSQLLFKSAWASPGRDLNSGLLLPTEDERVARQSTRPNSKHTPITKQRRVSTIPGNTKNTVGRWKWQQILKKTQVNNFLFFNYFFHFPSLLCLLHFELCLEANTTFAPTLPYFELPWLPIFAAGFPSWRLWH